MNKPAGWETAQAYDGSYRTLPPGGYVCAIKDARVEDNGYGEKIMVALDVCEGEYAGIFGDIFKSRQRSGGAKWPCVYDQFTHTRDGDTNGWFKGFITAVERSNPGFVWAWDERTLKGKAVGFVFGVEEWIGNDGTLRASTKPRIARDIKSIRDGDFTVPPKKEAAQGATLSQATPSAPQIDVNGFERVEEDLPF